MRTARIILIAAVVLTAAWLAALLFAPLPAPTRPPPRRAAPVEPAPPAPPRPAAGGAARGASSGAPRAAPAPRALRPQAPPAATNGAAAIPGEYVFGFFNRADRDAFIRAAEAGGIAVLDRLDVGNAVRIRTDDERRLAALLAEAPLALKRSPNYATRIPSPAEAPSDAPAAVRERFAEEWRTALGMSGMPAARGAGALVAVLDTALRPHPALLEPNITRADIGATGAADGPAAWHGTAVASIIAGAEGGLTGVAPAADLLGIPVLDGEGRGDAFTVAKGIVEAVNRGAAVINLCLGTEGDSFILEEAVRYAVERGVAVVASVGNEGADGARYPARYDGVVGVASVDALGRPAGFSNRGAGVDLAAPGVAVPAAGGEGAVARISGTSASAPFVSGALALLMGAGRLSAAEAVAVLERCANDVGAPGKDDATGAGMIDLARIAERDTPGVRDIAVGFPHVYAAADGRLAVAVTAQNRGTEPLADAKLEMTVNRVTRVASRAALAPGETLAAEIRLSGGQERADVSALATFAGGNDVRPANNAVGVVLKLER
ncbi:MAG: hypothetical protein FJ225_03130 [Lentisphaerae bacterium]|nr:hypothetical protein [Lentisphaerota bacterium]